MTEYVVPGVAMVEAHVPVTATSIRRGDRLDIGGTILRVGDLVSSAGEAKRVVFTTGESLVIRPGTVVSVRRTLPIRRRPRRRP